MKLWTVLFCLATSGSTFLAAEPGTVTNAEPARRITYDTFRPILEKNIFNQNRFARSGRTERREVRTNAIVDNLTLAGTMSYEKGDVAFFDGSRSDYRKPVRLKEMVGPFELTEISYQGVKLRTGTNQFELAVGMQLRREDEGDWRVNAPLDTTAASTAGSSSAAPSHSDNSTPPSSGGGEDDVLKRLMQRREQEMNR